MNQNEIQRDERGWYHERCGRWFPNYDSKGNDNARERSWLRHTCEAITPNQLRYPEWHRMWNLLNDWQKRARER